MKLYGKAAQAFLDRLAREYDEAPIVERNAQYYDTFARADERVTVELCHGMWRTFRRGSGCRPGEHESREAAKARALRLLGRP